MDDWGLDTLSPKDNATQPSQDASFDASSSGFELPAPKEAFKTEAPSGSNEWMLDSAPVSPFSSPASASEQPKASPHRRRGFVLLFSVLALLVVTLIAGFMLQGQSLPGQVQVIQHVNADGSVTLDLSYQIDNLNSSDMYFAGFAMSPDGVTMVAICEPVLIAGQTQKHVTASVTINAAGSYQLLFYYFPLSNVALQTTSLQQVQVSASVPQGPSVAANWLTTPVPSTRPNVLPTAAPRPTTRAQVVVTPEPSSGPQATARPTAQPQRPATVRTRPDSQHFDLYPAETRYFYQQLTTNEKYLYSQMYDGVTSFREKIEFSDSYTQEEFDHALFVLLYDSPELFFIALQDGGTYWTYPDSNKRITALKLEYSMTAGEYTATLQQVMQEIRSMQHKKGFGSTDYSRQLTIYRHLITVNHYDKKRPFCGVANSAWLLGYSKCSGYARALNLALRYYGITCFEIAGNTFDNGVVSPEGHMWNAVCLDGSWYYCDPTWDDPSGMEIDVLAGDIDYLPYLNITTRKMFSARELDPKWDFALPECTATKYLYYSQEGCRVRSGEDIPTAIQNAITQAYLNGSDVAALSFDSATDYATAMLSLKKTCSKWRNNGVRLVSYSWYCSPDTNVLYFCNLVFSGN